MTKQTMSSNQEKTEISRLVLFDIDHTLIFGAGAGSRAIARAVEKCLGVTADQLKLANIRMSGKTDPQIIAEIIAACDISCDTTEHVIETYLRFLPEEIANTANYKLLDGVRELIEILETDNKIVLGLLTGNVEIGAKIKLSRFNLNKHFPVGAYGSDSINRLDLPAIAHRRAEEYYSIKFAPNQIVIIGDAENDVLCAKHYGAISLAVNTGTTTWQELKQHEPHYIFPSLKETANIVQAILSETVLSEKATRI